MTIFISKIYNFNRFTYLFIYKKRKQQEAQSLVVSKQKAGKDVALIVCHLVTGIFL